MQEREMLLNVSTNRKRREKKDKQRLMQIKKELKREMKPFKKRLKSLRLINQNQQK